MNIHKPATTEAEEIQRRRIKNARKAAARAAKVPVTIFANVPIRLYCQNGRPA